VQKTFLTPLLKRSSHPQRLVNSRSGGILATSVIAAFDSERRRKGLLGREAMEPGEALIIAPTNAIHMFFMRFAIDAVFCRRDGTVVSVRHRLRPWRVAIAPRAHFVIELPAGTAQATGTRRGDQLLLEPLATVTQP
jgi:uncharacterized membrane protein (UPF0127 family)